MTGRVFVPSSFVVESIAEMGWVSASKVNAWERVHERKPGHDAASRMELEEAL